MEFDEEAAWHQQHEATAHQHTAFLFETAGPRRDKHAAASLGTISMNADE